MLRVTRPSRRGVFAGLLAGGLLVGGLAFAAGENVIHLPVTIPAFHWQVDGQPVKTSDRPGFVHNGTAYVPSAFLYNGTTYVRSASSASCSATALPMIHKQRPSPSTPSEEGRKPFPTA
ncbi:hypothetical protein [Calditerricola satsumensis]|uniref:hypothetical protein n=1 Tax=Calditerricola satsumensis TaxID=373054 RepID=UPI0006D2057C|nr:hypothetical protein [Calditerricola satsumensis]